MRALSGRAAGTCEGAKSKRCRCRCGGQFHGTARVANVAELPAGDPHAVKDAAPARPEVVDLVVQALAVEEQLRWDLYSRWAVEAMARADYL
jgi:hypothetical protein